MKAPTLFAQDGRPLPLDRRVGKGGEGEVYAVEGSTETLVKFYTLSDLDSREAKVKAMIAKGLAKASPLIAFPVQIVKDKAGKFAGFTMKRVNEHQALHELYSPGARKAAFPRADYRFLVRSAANISRAVAAAHHSDCVIGDINHSGVLVSDEATAALIDADSFQVSDGATQHLCKVGVPEYTPPELQGRRLDRVARTPNHDAFGLAVMIFQLLWMGRHPYAGRYRQGEMPLEKAIAEFRFAYSKCRDVGMEAPPAVPNLSDFPPQIAAAFEQAFGPGGTQDRPTAKRWIALLTELEQALRPCAMNALHYYPASGPDCPWCRMERLQGVQLFVPPSHAFRSGSATLSGGASGDLAALWKAIEAVQPPPVGPHTPFVQPTSREPSAEARNAKGKPWARKIWGLGFLAIAGAVLLGQPSLWLVWLASGGWGLVLLFGTGDDSRRLRFLSTARDTELRWLQALHDWQTRMDQTDFTATKAGLTTLKVEIEKLPSQEQARIQAYEANRRAEHLRVHLEKFQIRRFKIAGIGPSKRATLTSYGIETAADVTPSAIQRVPGFGPVSSRPLLEWRQKHEATFRYTATPTAADRAAIMAIKNDFALKATGLKAKLATGPTELKKAAAQTRQKLSAVDPTLQRLHEQRTQAAVDLKLLGLTLPPVSFTPRPAARPALAPRNTYIPNPIPPPLRPTGKGGVSCPTCGGGMVLRTARKGKNRGGRFYGCARFPRCRGVRPGP